VLLYSETYLLKVCGVVLTIASLLLMPLSALIHHCLVAYATVKREPIHSIHKDSYLRQYVRVNGKFYVPAVYHRDLFNLLMPNVNYSGRTAPLTSKVAFYVFIQQI